MNRSPQSMSLAFNAVLVMATALTLFPLVWVAYASLLPDSEATRSFSGFGVERLTLVHYRTLFAKLDLATYLGNSVGLASVVTLVSTFFNALAGYAFAKFSFAWRDNLFKFLMASMIIPGQVAMLPLFLMLKSMGLINSYGGVIVPGMASLFGIFLVRQYARSIPDSLLDAARIDGAGEFRIFFSIVIPLIKPVLVTLALFTFMGTWNNFLWPLIVLTGNERYTLPVALANLMGEHAEDTELMMAGSMLTLLPMVALFLALQRYYLEGLILGSVKE